MDNSKVWYVCYGSNLLRDRFMYYIRGGVMKNGKCYTGCRDKAEPMADERININRPLYFAKESGTWERKAVAFIGEKEVNDNPTKGRMYLITLEQFKGVVNQENSRKAEEEFEIDFEVLMKNGELVIHCLGSWYGRLIYLGEHGGHPAVTFTAVWNMGDVKYNSPGRDYLSVIISGLKESYPSMSNNDAADYLINKNGIREYGEYDINKLRELAETVTGKADPII